MKYRVEHVRYTVNEGVSYTETIDNTDKQLTEDQLLDGYIDFCREHDWLKLIDNETDEVVATTEDIEIVFWLDYQENQFYGEKVVLYKKYGDRDTNLYDEQEVFSAYFDDIQGLKDAMDEGDMIKAYELIDAHIQQDLGYVPDYTVG